MERLLRPFGGSRRGGAEQENAYSENLKAPLFSPVVARQVLASAQPLGSRKSGQNKVLRPDAQHENRETAMKRGSFFLLPPPAQTNRRR